MKRVLTAAVLIPVVLGAIFFAPWWALLGVIGVVATLCFVEYSRTLRIDRQALALGLVAGWTLLWAPADRIALPALLFALLAFTLPLLKDDLGSALNRSALMYLGVLYTFGSMKTAYLLALRSPWWLFFALSLNWVGDSGAYYIGSNFGKHKLAPRISPGKSWEGTVASVICSTLFAVLAFPTVQPVSALMAVVLAVTGNLVGQVGDLAESALKRGVGAKDSGNLLPGHGGMLDRMDSALFTLPTIYGLMVLMRL